MKNHYILFLIAFIIFGIHNSISSRIKDGDILATKYFFPNMMLRATPIIGYILLAINLYSEFYWVYGIVMFLVGLLLIPAIFIKILHFIYPKGIVKYISNPLPITIIVVIVLSVLMLVLLTINLLKN